MGSSDVILGIKWLRTLGDMPVNWRDLKMTLWEGNRQVMLTGNPSLSRTLISIMKSLTRMLKHESNLFLLQLNTTEKTETPNRLPLEFQALIDEHHDIFEMLSGLPPSSNHKSTQSLYKE